MSVYDVRHNVSLQKLPNCQFGGLKVISCYIVCVYQYYKLVKLVYGYRRQPSLYTPLVLVFKKSVFKYRKLFCYEVSFSFTESKIIELECDNDYAVSLIYTDLSSLLISTIFPHCPVDCLLLLFL